MTQIHIPPVKFLAGFFEEYTFPPKIYREGKKMHAWRQIKSGAKISPLPKLHDLGKSVHLFEL